MSREWVVGFVVPDGLRAVDLLGVYKGGLEGESAWTVVFLRGE